MLNTNLFPNPAEVAEKMIDQWVSSYAFFSKAQDQADTVTRTWLDQGRTAREQGQKVVVQVAEQIKQNQRLFQEMVQANVTLMLETQRIASQQGISEISKRVDELSKQVDSMTKAAQSKVAAHN